MSVRRIGKINNQQGFEDKHRAWVTQRTKWSAMLLFAVAVIIGLVGMGQLHSSYAQGNNGSIDVEYTLFTRYHSLSTFQIRVQPAATTQDKVQLYLNKSFVENIYLRKIEPRPESVAVGFQSVVYTFKVPENSSALNIIYQFEPNTHGKQTVDISTQDSPGATFNQFIFP